MSKVEPKIDPLTARWQQAITDLLARLDACDHDIAEAKRSAGKKLARVRDGDARLEDGALSPLLRAQAKRDALESALADAKAKLAAVPQAIIDFDKALAPLAPAVARRDAILAEAVTMLRALHACLLDLRASNSEAVALLGQAYKAWGRIGRPPELEPRFVPVQFPAQLHRAFFRDTPFLGSVTLRGDSSSPVLRMRANAFDGDEAEAWALADPDTNQPPAL